MRKKVDITIHAGHNKNGKVACGAIGYADESKVTRDLLKIVKKKLKKHKISFVDITVNNGKSQNDVLQKLQKKQSNYRSKFNISLHLNSSENKEANGCEILYKLNRPDSSVYAQKIKRLGFTWRGNKQTDMLYILNHFNSETYLMELFFCSNKHDYSLYKKNIDKVASSIVWFILTQLGRVKG